MKIADSLYLIERELEANPQQVSIILSKANAKTLIHHYRKYESLRAEMNKWRTRAKYYEEVYKSTKAQLNRKEREHV